MTTIQSLQNITTRLEAYEAQLKSSRSISPADAVEMLAETEKMNDVFQEMEFQMEWPDLFGNQDLKEPLKKAQNIYKRVIGYISDALNEEPEQTSRALTKRSREDSSDSQQPSKFLRIETGEDNQFTLLHFPTEILQLILGLLGKESQFVLRHVCSLFKNVIQLKRPRDPVQQLALVSIDTPINFCLKAAEEGYMDLLKWAANDPGIFELDEDTCTLAAKNGHLETLKWLRANGCPWNGEACDNAALNGHLETLKWLRANGCPWDEETCSNAALNGHLEILKWAKANGCPWNEDTCSFAARKWPT